MARLAIFPAVGLIALIAACSGGSGGGGGGQKYSPERLKAIEKATKVVVDDREFKVAIMPDRRSALVVGQRGPDTSFLQIERAAAKASGCAARFNVRLFDEPLPFHYFRKPVSSDSSAKVTLDCTKPAKSHAETRFEDQQEILSRPIQIPEYPQPDRTYLSFSQAHGFQVNYIASEGRAWLWYPRNRRSLPEEYVVLPDKRICWRHSRKAYNPVTQQRGGAFGCQDLEFSQKTVVAALDGDPFKLSSGTVPSQRKKCVAPSEFDFDRTRYRCGYQSGEPVASIAPLNKRLLVTEAPAAIELGCAQISLTDSFLSPDGDYVVTVPAPPPSTPGAKVLLIFRFSTDGTVAYRLSGVLPLGTGRVTFPKTTARGEQEKCFSYSNGVATTVLSDGRTYSFNEEQGVLFLQVRGPGSQLEQVHRVEFRQ